MSSKKKTAVAETSGGRKKGRPRSTPTPSDAVTIENAAPEAMVEQLAPKAEVETTGPEAAVESTRDVFDIPVAHPIETAEQAPASAKTKGKAKAPAAAALKLSALDAAARVLAEAGTSLNCQAMIDAMAAKGYWTSPGGKTPAATLYAAILHEMKVKGDAARFEKISRGLFGLRAKTV